MINNAIMNADLNIVPLQIYSINFFSDGCNMYSNVNVPYHVIFTSLI